MGNDPRRPTGHLQDVSKQLADLREQLDARTAALGSMLDEATHLQGSASSRLVLLGLDSELRVHGASGTEDLFGHALDVLGRGLDELLPDADPAKLTRGGVLRTARGDSVLAVTLSEVDGERQVLVVPWQNTTTAPPGELSYDEMVRLLRQVLHDFNNVLASMLGYAELAAMLSKEPQITQYLEQAVESGQRGHQLVSSVQRRIAQSRERTRADDDGAQPAFTPDLTCRALVVDDERNAANFLTDLLRSAGHKVTTFTDPLRALEHVADAPDGFDLAVVDQTMPGLTGTELALELDKLNPHLPVILCTGSGDMLRAQQQGNLPVDYLVTKPVDIRAFLDLVQQVLVGPMGMPGH